MLKEFKEFVARGSVIDLAVGVIMGAAFGKIVTTLVEGILMPPLGLVLGRIDFASLLYVLDRAATEVPASLADARVKGIPVLAYGQFINDIIGFVIVAVAVFVLVRQVNRMKRAEEPPPASPTRDCAYCASAIPVRATRCPHCTSQLT
jgi:large conductance mechanosensitive channel